MQEAARNGAAKICGYEANGGFLLWSPVARNGKRLAALPTRDAVLPIVSVLAAATRRPIADLCRELPPRVTYSDRLKDFATADSQAILAWLRSGSEQERKARIEAHFGSLAGRLTQIDETDGLRMSFDSGAVIHLRPSGNAPELRCYSESDSEETARDLNAAALKIVSDDLSKAMRKPA